MIESAVTEAVCDALVEQADWQRNPGQHATWIAMSQGWPVVTIPARVVKWFGGREPDDWGVQLLRYVPGDQFGWHVDRFADGSQDRTISVVIQLSHGDEYTGGDVEFVDPNGETVTLASSEGQHRRVHRRHAPPCHPGHVRVPSQLVGVRSGTSRRRSPSPRGWRGDPSTAQPATVRIGPTVGARFFHKPHRDDVWQ